MRNVWLGLLAVAGGCGGNDGGGGGVHFGNDVPLADMADTMAEVYCGEIFDCCPDPGMTQEVCQAQLGGFMEGFFTSALMQSQDAGRATYHGDRFADCLRILESLGCDEIRSGQTDAIIDSSDCAEWIEPHQGVGDECAQGFECTTGNCEGASGMFGDPPELGTCEVVPGADEACDDACVDGYYCEWLEGTCLPRKADGEECGGDDECLSDACVDAAVEGDPSTCGTEDLCDSFSMGG